VVPVQLVAGGSRPERRAVMWSRRRFLGVGAGVGVAAALRPYPLERLSAAARSVDGLPPEQVAHDEDFWFEVSQAFTVDRNIINLNNGTLQPSLRVVQDAMRRHYEFSANAGFHTTAYFSKECEVVRRRLASHAGCDCEELAITRCGSESGEIAVMGIDLKPGDEVVTTDQDYPRFINSWKQREKREGIVLRIVELPAPPVPLDTFYDRVLGAVTPRTKVIHVCHMTHLTAQVAPFKRLAAFARPRGIQVILDGAHGFMHVPVDVRDFDCDYYIASLHKWCMAPPGNGFLYVRRSRLASLWPLTPAPDGQKDDIRKLEDVGTRTFANRAAIAEALAFNEGLGIERKSARLRYLKERWVNRLKTNPRVRLYSSLDPAESCAIATFGIDGADHAKLAQKLLDDHSIVVSHMTHRTFQGFRIVPNISMTLKEIDYFGEVMEKEIKNSLT
jgi:isopenicillin-N epimerase